MCVRTGVNSGSRRKDFQPVEFRSIDRKFTGLCTDVGGSSNRSNKSHPVILSLFASVQFNAIFVNIWKIPRNPEILIRFFCYGFIQKHSCPLQNVAQQMETAQIQFLWASNPGSAGHSEIIGLKSRHLCLKGGNTGWRQLKLFL